MTTSTVAPSVIDARTNAPLQADNPLTSQLVGEWDIDPVHSQLEFSARHAMVTRVKGSFSDFHGTVSLPAANIDLLKVNLEAATKSITTRSVDRDAHLVSADFLDTENYPELTFVSTTAQWDDDVLRLQGDLTIKGVTKPVTIDFTFDGVATDPFGNVRAGFEGELTISRSDWGLTWNAALETGGVLVSDKVKLTILVSAVKTNPAA